MNEAAFWIQQGLNGAALCAFYMPLAVSFALVQGISNKIFLSLGDIAMFAAFAAIYIALWRYLAGDDNGPLLSLALVAAMLCSAGLGHFVSRQVFSPLIHQPSQAFMIAAVGFSIALQEVMRLQSSARTIWLPPLYGMETVAFGEGASLVSVSPSALVVSVTSLGFVALLYVFMRRSRFGRLWQACSQDARLAALTGVDVDRVLSLTCILSAVTASLSGWTIAVSYGGVSFTLGLMSGFKAMFASVVGGFGTFSGAVVGAIFLALAETLWTSSFPLAYRDVAIFSLITLILILKPEGLMGTPIRRDSAL